MSDCVNRETFKSPRLCIVSYEAAGFGDEPVPVPGNRLNVAMILRIRTEGLANRRNVHCQIDFLDKGVRPDLFR